MPVQITPDDSKMIIIVATATVEAGCMVVMPEPGVMPGVIPGPFSIFSSFVSSMGALAKYASIVSPGGKAIRLSASVLEIKAAGGASAKMFVEGSKF